MSGLTGLFRYRGTVDNDEIGRMNDSLSHRGPDGSSTYTMGPVGFGHQYFQTTPESEYVSQPVHDSNYLFTCDARIDNREELIGDLDIDRQKISDAELILEAYDKWGKRCPDHLLGSFAFGIWDAIREELFLVRDHMGIKPLYYYRGGDVFAFATEMKALLSQDFVDATIDETRIGTYLAGQMNGGGCTSFEDICRLPPATAMSIERDSVSKRVYWKPDPTREIQLESDQAYAERFRELFVDAVRKRIRGGPPVGSTLSGGLDSSSVACTAERIRDFDDPIEAFSLVYDEVEVCDEREYIETVLDAGDFNSHYVPGDRDGPLSFLDECLWCIDEPFVGTHMFLYWNLYSRANTEGVRILLEGVDGDTTVSHGFGYLVELAVKGRLLKMFQAAHHASQFDIFQQWSTWEVLWRRVLTTLAPDPARKLWRKVHGQADTLKRSNPVIDETFSDEIDLESLMSQSDMRFSPPKTERQHHYNQLQSFPATAFEMANHVGNFHNVEPRFPFFDKRLVDFCLALPPTQKFHRDGTRIILRRSLEGVLPEKIRMRTDKTSSHENFRIGLLERNSHVLSDLLFDSSLDGFIDSAKMTIKYDEMRQGTGDDLESLWRTATLSRWLQRLDRLDFDPEEDDVLSVNHP